jgi:DNA mismatch repair protein MutS2
VVGSRLRGELQTFRERVTRSLGAELERLRTEFAAGKRRVAAGESAARLFEGAPALGEASESGPTGPLEVGGRVRHRRLGWTGKLDRLDGERAQVLVGGKRLAAAAGDLAALAGPAARPAAAEAAEPPAPEGPAELHLIGLRVEEALAVLDGFLDRALREARREVRIVHGHGTGRLRDGVRRHLQRHPAAAASRPGAPNEGGDGATVVTLRG